MAKEKLLLRFKLSIFVHRVYNSIAVVACTVIVMASTGKHRVHLTDEFQLGRLCFAAIDKLEGEFRVAGGGLLRCGVLAMKDVRSKHIFLRQQKRIDCVVNSVTTARVCKVLCDTARCWERVACDSLQSPSKAATGLKSRKKWPTAISQG